MTAGPPGASVRFDVHAVATDSSNGGPVLSDFDDDGRADPPTPRLALRAPDGSLNPAVAWCGATTDFAHAAFDGTPDGNTDLYTVFPSGSDTCTVRRWDGDGFGGIGNASPGFT
jgi:hypothetical protein